jgi:hypothetical protein
MKKLILIFLLLVSVANAGEKHNYHHKAGRGKVYDNNYQLKYRIKDNKVYDTNYQLKYRIRNNKVYDTNYQLKYRIKRSR